LSKKDEDILEAIDIMVQERLKELKFNRYIQVKITVDNGNNTYDVLYNNQTIPNVKVRAGLTLSVNDICYCMIPNNQFSLLFLDCKVPN